MPRREKLRHSEFGLQIAERYEGLSLPTTNYPCPVRVDLLETVQDPLFKHGLIDKKVKVADLVNNDFVEEIRAELD